MPEFDVNINATLSVNDTVWEHLIEACRQYDAVTPEELVEEGLANTLLQAEKILLADLEEAAEQALQELADDLEGSTLDSIYGSAWVCSVEEPTEM
jgi:hypothetical protein